MALSTLLKPISSQPSLSFKISNIDNLFPGFARGDFAFLYGTSTVLPLSLLLTVRAQLPFQLGGLETNVIFIDGSNTFRLYDVSCLAQIHQLDPKQVLERIYISRAFTAHQLTSIILEKLKETVEKFHSKFVIISDMPRLYLDKDVPTTEAKEVFSQLTSYLLKIAEEDQLIIIATYFRHHYSKRSIFFHEIACGRANVVISTRQSKAHKEFVLEKHPTFCPGYAKFPSENLTLNEFMEE